MKRASGIGATAGLLALFLWPFCALYGPVLLLIFLLLSAIAGLCGFSLLAMTAYDIARHPRRGIRIRPIRSFDTLLGIGLLALSLFELRDAWGLLPA